MKMKFQTDPFLILKHDNLPTTITDEVKGEDAIVKGEHSEWRKYDIQLSEPTNPDRVRTFRITDDTVDKVSDVVLAEGVDLTEYRKNPVFLTMHDSRQWPIGKAVAMKVEDGAIYAAFEFDTKDVDEVADKLLKKVDTGTIRCVSIGFRPKQMVWKGASSNTTDQDLMFMRYPGCDRIITQSLLREVSLVPIGANPNAVQVKADDPEFLKQLALQIQPMIAKEVESVKVTVAKALSDLGAAVVTLGKKSDAAEVTSKAIVKLLEDHGAKIEGVLASKTWEGDEGKGEHQPAGAEGKGDAGESGKQKDQSGAESGKSAETDPDTDEEADTKSLFEKLDQIGSIFKAGDAEDGGSEDGGEPDEEEESDDDE